MVITNLFLFKITDLNFLDLPETFPPFPIPFPNFADSLWPL